MSTKNIYLLRDFHSNPYGRYFVEGDGKNELGEDTSGAGFRKKILIKSLLENDKIHIFLDGSNRYGRSFLEEAFGGLIRREGMTLEEVNSRVSFSHDLLPEIIRLINSRLHAAEKDRLDSL